MPFLVIGEALVDLIAEQAADGIAEAGSFTLDQRRQTPIAFAIVDWNAADPSLRDVLGAAAEAGARATESWGAVA